MASGGSVPSVLLRRWYATLAGVAITAALVVAAMSMVPVQYSATSYVLIVPPKPSSQQQGQNTLLALGGLQPTADVLARSMTDPPVAKALASQGVSPNYTVTRDLTTAGPILIVTSQESTSEQALNSDKRLTAQISSNLRTLQDSVNVPANARATTVTLSPAARANPVIKKQLRVVLVAVAVGLLVTILGVSLLDGLLRRRQRRPSEADSDIASERRLPTSNVPAASANANGHTGPQPGPARQPVRAEPTVRRGDAGSDRATSRVTQTNRLGAPRSRVPLRRASHSHSPTERNRDT
jgi:hypothetical protein